MAKIYLSIGSNYRREENITAALHLLQQLFGEIELSPIYRSKAINEGGNDYFNLVIGVKAENNIKTLRQQLRGIEAQLDRDRNDPRRVSIDIDLLLYDDCVGEFEGGELPHPDIARYRHVSQPLADLIPDTLHPALQQSYKAISEQTDGDVAMVTIN